MGSKVVAQQISTNQLLVALKAAGEATRLRILALLAVRELNVSDLTNILDQSQPRISRHLRLLDEAGLIERFREGSFVYCRLVQKEVVGELVYTAIGLLDRKDLVLSADRIRAEKIQEERVAASQIWFKANAAKWDQIRSLYISDHKVEAAMLDMLGVKTKDCPFNLLLDLGTGTGRVLELLAHKTHQAIGYDSSHSMLEYARSRLAHKCFDHCQVRQGDLIDLSVEDGQADLVVLHQVLHFLFEPEKGVFEAARLLQPGGQMLIVDFAPHNLDIFREEFAHERLGFSEHQMALWLKRSGLVEKQKIQLAADENKTDEKLVVSLWLAQKAVSSAGVKLVTTNHSSPQNRTKKMQGNAK
ncbi:MAG: metalloregulator ArsR/SmtB family transcription factor [bacterium]|nr:metalloregulator ArsR/SmtB family transcription factor [bacterium]